MAKLIIGTALLTVRKIISSVEMYLVLHDQLHRICEGAHNAGFDDDKLPGVVEDEAGVVLLENIFGLGLLLEEGHHGSGDFEALRRPIQGI